MHSWKTRVILLALTLFVALCPPQCALALSALNGVQIDGTTAEETVGDTIRGNADAARALRAYDDLAVLRIGLTVSGSVYIHDENGEPKGLDVDILSAVFGTMGYRAVNGSADEQYEPSEEETAQPKDNMVYELVLIEDNMLVSALAEGTVDLIAGDTRLFSAEDDLIKSESYYSGRRTVRTSDGKTLDFTGVAFAVYGPQGASSLIDSLTTRINALQADGTLDVCEEAYFTSNALGRLWANVRRSATSLAREFERNLIREDRYMMLLRGLGSTLKIAGVACVFGVLLGSCVALMRLSTVHIGRWKVLSWLATRYVNIIRGTPVVVQLMIIYYIVLTAPSKTIAAMMTFSINSAAYVSEMVRGGILAVDKGQTEAGRSLGLSASGTMCLIVLPQTIKIILPSLFNEFIMLLKETSVVGFIGLMDLSKAGDFIRSRTYSAFFPLIAVAVIYLALVTVLTKVFARVERRLRESDNR